MLEISGYVEANVLLMVSPMQLIYECPRNRMIFSQIQMNRSHDSLSEPDIPIRIKKPSDVQTPMQC